MQPQPLSAIFSLCTVAILECCTSQTCLGLTNVLLTCWTLALGCALSHAMSPSAGTTWSSQLTFPGVSSGHCSTCQGWVTEKCHLAQYLGFLQEETGFRVLPTQTSARRHFLPTGMNRHSRGRKRKSGEGFHLALCRVLVLPGMLLPAARYYFTAQSACPCVLLRASHVHPCRLPFPHSCWDGLGLFPRCCSCVAFLLAMHLQTPVTRELSPASNPLFLPHILWPLTFKRE